MTSTVRRLAGTVALFLAVSPMAVAVAQTLDGIAQELELRGYHIGADADVTLAEMEGLVDRYPGFGFVALDATPSGGADLLADRLLDAAPSIRTVVVLTADEAGAASADHDDAAMDRAFDAAFSTTGDTYLRDFEQVAEALTAGGGPFPSGPGTTVPGGSGSSSGGFPLIWLIVLGGVAYFGYRMWRNSQDDERAVGRRTAEAKQEIESQMAVVANQILELSDRPALSGNHEATEHFRQASGIFRSAEERLATAATSADLAALADDLDDARWELAAAEALLEGRPLPERPEQDHPEPCFFDPTHGAGTEEAQLSTPAGTRTVRVCRADAERLRQGERPEPRTVTVDGRPVPTAAAPRSYGGRGMDALDIFSILVGGMGDAASYRWGGGRRRSPTFGGLPGGIGGGRTRGAASAARAARSVGRVARSVGRARRGR